MLYVSYLSTSVDAVSDSEGADNYWLRTWRIVALWFFLPQHQHGSVLPFTVKGCEPNPSLLHAPVKTCPVTTV